MRNLLRITTLVIAIGTALPSVAGAQVSFGIRIGPPPRPRVVRVVPRRPGVGYVWIEGYWYPVGGRYRWHEGYWTLPPYAGARWVGPRYERNEFFGGYWEGSRGRFEHDHRWDRDRGRDRDRDRDDNPGRGRARGRR